MAGEDGLFVESVLGMEPAGDVAVLLLELAVKGVPVDGVVEVVLDVVELTLDGMLYVLGIARACN